MDWAVNVNSVSLRVARPDRGEFAWSVTIAADQPRDRTTAKEVQAVLARAADAAPSSDPARAADAAPSSDPTADPPDALTGDLADYAVQLWIEQAADGDDDFAAELGFRPYRDLWRMQRPLPADPSTIVTRDFVPGADDEAFLRVNNRAFHWHPEQGGMTAKDLADRMAESWFDAAGFRLHEREGRLAGFCWTKAHPDETPPGGEIYAIAVDPDFHGQGLGKPMTLAGLDHLAARGLTVGFLYVESDNDAAVATYRSLGFDHISTNRAYRLLAT